MRKQAYFVAGRHPRDRDKSDPSVKSSLEDALKILNHVGDSIGEPLVSGGTTADPDVILMLGWLAITTDQSVGVYVRFYGNNKCDVISVMPNKEIIKKDLSVEEVIKYNIIRQYNFINEQMRPYRLDRPAP